MEFFQAEVIPKTGTSDFQAVHRLDPPGPFDLLALEEALLEHCESHDHGGFLHFWESRRYFVVLGFSKKWKEEVFEDECGRLEIPILRRASGGGTVLQGPGCFNYTLVLPIESAPQLETITSTNAFVMERVRSAMAHLVSGEVRVQGHTDLTLDGLKFSGNAQRRKRRAILFHGSFLLDFNLELISTVLRQPQQQPDYRRNRLHGEFLTNLRLESEKVRAALMEAWDASAISSPPPVVKDVLAAADELVRTKYSKVEWNLRA